MNRRFIPALGVLLFAGILLAGLCLPGGPGSPVPSPATADATNLDRGIRLETAGDPTGAAGAYMDALEADESVRPMLARLSRLVATEGFRGSPELSARLRALMDRFARLERREEAESVAKLVLRFDGDNETAHRLLGDELIDGKWLDQAERELELLVRTKRRENEQFDRLSPREKEIYEIRQDLDKAWDLRADDRMWFDFSPESPFVFCVEKATGVVEGVLEDELRRNARAFFEDFARRFGDCFDPKVVAEKDVCFVYVFRDRDRYENYAEVPDWLGGHFNARQRRSYVYLNSPDFLESLFHEYAHQLLSAIVARRAMPATALGGDSACWFVEGLTAFYEGFGRAPDHQVEFGRVAADWQTRAKGIAKRSTLRPLDEFMELTWDGFTSTPTKSNRMMNVVAQSWALVYFLETAGTGKDREGFLKYFRRAIAGRVGIDDARACLGDLDELDARFREFLKRD